MFFLEERALAQIPKQLVPSESLQHYLDMLLLLPFGLLRR